MKEILLCLFVLEYFDFNEMLYLVCKKKNNNGHYFALKILNNRLSVLLGSVVIHPTSKSLKDLREVFAPEVCSFNVFPP